MQWVSKTKKKLVLFSEIGRVDIFFITHKNTRKQKKLKKKREYLRKID